MGYLLKQSQTAQPLLFLMLDSGDHVTGKTGLSPTVTISKNGGSFASPAGAVTEIANGWYAVAGNATDSATLGPLLLHATGAGADPCDDRFDVVAFDPQSATSLGLSNLDAAITSRLASGSYTAPDNSSITAIKAKTDNLPAAPASTTNITAGTITTVTNLTNAPTSGDLTATMKASVTTAVPTSSDIATAVWAAGTRTLTSFGTLVSDVWSYATRLLTAGTNIVLAKGTGITGFNDPTAAANASAVRSEITTELSRIDVAVSTRLATAGYTAPPSAATVADAVLDEAVSDHTTAGTTGAQLASIYAAQIDFADDEDNATDEYSVQWFKNGAPVTSGITSPTIQVIKRADGTDLVASSAMTQIGSTGAYKYDETTNRVTSGEAVLVQVQATIDGSARTWRKLVSRDTA